ncbi:MAG: hypothetical protein BWK80_24680 [Desulfobacteraceae bacterium IS3]|nr:MAG: hypothetical protein BWK80_24680 [Desulfobacteraceae bacterium IS3]
MREKDLRKPLKSDRTFRRVIIFAVTMTGLLGGLWFWKQHPDILEKVIGEAPSAVKKLSKKIEPPSEKVIDYSKLKTDPQVKETMEQRKEQYGVDKKIDMVVKPDESVKIADSTVPMQEILDKIQEKEGQIAEKDLVKKPDAAASAEKPPAVTSDPEPLTSETDTGQNKPLRKKIFAMSIPSQGAASQSPASADIENMDEVYGIYVVRHGDNVWNIHFEFLKEYFKNKGVSLAAFADEPRGRRSSGIGKILKFSEDMVYIYNLREHKLDLDLNTIHPLSKIVVFNLRRAFSLLNQLDYNTVNRIRFDGKTIWIPAAQ